MAKEKTMRMKMREEGLDGVQRERRKLANE
jgi:hypothetical protein